MEEAIDTTCADLIVHYIAQLGIDTVFGVTGGAIEPFLNALARSERRGGPRFVLARHECGAAFMADGYARETGKIGIVCSTSGPGATNLITGLASAYVDEVPMLVITAQTPLPKFGKRALQESSCTAIDTVGMLRYVTRFNTLVSHPDQLKSKLVSAIMTANRAPRGPVHLSIPADLARTKINTPLPPIRDLLIHPVPQTDEIAIETLCEKVGSVKSLVVYIGNGIGSATRSVMEFIELANAPFITDPAGKAWIDERHPLYRGVYGYGGHESARTLIRNNVVDLVIAVGTPLDELGTSGWTTELLNTKLVHIDSEVEHFTRSPMASLHILGNIDTIFNRLIAFVRSIAKTKQSWSPCRDSQLNLNIQGGFYTLRSPEKCLSDEHPIKPQRLMHHLSYHLPDDTRIFVDAGNAWAWTIHYLSRRDREGFYRAGWGLGSMMWAIGASIGSAIGNRRAPTLCITGDGAYLMSAQEITVAAQQNIPVVFLVLNDSALGMVMHGQKLGNQESIGWQLNKVDYAAMARAMGVDGIVIESPSQLDTLDWTAMFRKNQPTLLDVRIDRDEVPPMEDRIVGLSVTGSRTLGG